MLSDRQSAHQQATGAGLVLLSTLAWSFSGLFTRALSTDVMSAIAWRAFFGCVFLLVPFFIRKRGDAWSGFTLSWPSAFLVLCVTGCSACTVGALYFTSIANTAVIYATAPFMAAALAFVLVGERLKPRTLAASAVSVLGVVIIVSSGIEAGGLFGDVLAVGMTLTFAFMIVIPRMYPSLDLAAASIVGAAVTTLCFAPFGHAGAMTAHDWIVLAVFGFTNFTVALYLFLAGARHLAAAQAALIGTLDVVLAPLWVWIAYGERPSLATFVGGGLIFVVVVWYTVLEWLEERRAGTPVVAAEGTNAAAC